MTSSYENPDIMNVREIIDTAFGDFEVSCSYIKQSSKICNEIEFSKHFHNNYNYRETP